MGIVLYIQFEFNLNVTCRSLSPSHTDYHHSLFTLALCHALLDNQITISDNPVLGWKLLVSLV